MHHRLRSAPVVVGLAVVVLFGLGACEPPPEVGPVIHREGTISGVRSGSGGEYKVVTLTGTSACSIDENVEMLGDIVQGDVRSHVEGGFACQAGKTVEWTMAFADGGFPPDPRLQPGLVTVEIQFDGYDSFDRVEITRDVTLAAV